MRRYVQWLAGYERGCMRACHCRPTARRARHILAMIRWAISAAIRLDGLSTILAFVFKRHVTIE